jgi:transketolase
MRSRFAEILLEEASKNPNLFLLTGDLGYGVLDKFMTVAPSQFVNCGVAEQNMIGVAGGLSSLGKKVFVYSIANFPTFRCLEQIRNDLVYMGNNVSIVSVGAGFSYGSQGYTHHGIEDVSIMRCLGKLKVYSPADTYELEAIMPELMTSNFTSYLRLGKGGEPLIHKNPISNVNQPILFQEFNSSSTSKLVGILSCGTIGSEILKIQTLHKGKFNYMAYSVPVLDKKHIKEFLLDKKFDLVITLEEHVLAGGFGSMILEVSSDYNLNLNIRNMGINSDNLESNGSQPYLRKIHKIDAVSIMEFIEQNL